MIFRIAMSTSRPLVFQGSSNLAARLGSLPSAGGACSVPVVLCPGASDPWASGSLWGARVVSVSQRTKNKFLVP